jgi:hypothetical protein
MSLNLSLLGLELDQLRRSRGDPTYSPTPSGEAELPTSPTLESETASSISPSSSPIQTTRHLAGHAEPYPLCLLCFSRTPSAVLLPCELAAWPHMAPHSHRD